MNEFLKGWCVKIIGRVGVDLELIVNMHMLDFKGIIMKEINLDYVGMDHHVDFYLGRNVGLNTITSQEKPLQGIVHKPEFNITMKEGKMGYVDITSNVEERYVLSNT